MWSHALGTPMTSQGGRGRGPEPTPTRRAEPSALFVGRASSHDAPGVGGYGAKGRISRSGWPNLPHEISSHPVFFQVHLLLALSGPTGIMKGAIRSLMDILGFARAASYSDACERPEKTFLGILKDGIQPGRAGAAWLRGCRQIAEQFP